MKAILTLMLSLLALGTTAQTIDNPRYDYRLSSEMNITRIERSRKATRLHIHAIKKAGRTFTVDSLWTIGSASDTTLALVPLRTEGVTLGESFEMPDNGTHDFVIVYPPLPRKTACIDFAPKTSNATIGLRLNATGNATPATAVSMGRDEWLAAHPDIVDESTGEDYDAATFFRQDTAWVRGQVGHYHAGVPLTVYPGFYLHMGGWRFRETKVNDDGTFLIPLYLDHPTTFSLRFFPKANLWAQASVMYIEPGDTLDVFVDWEEDLLDAWRDGTIFPLTIRGRLAEVNRQITAIPTPTFSYFSRGNTMEERLHNMMQGLFPWREQMNGYIQRADLYPKVRHYARAMKEVEFGTRLWDMMWISAYDSLSAVRRPLAHDDVEQFITNHYELDGWFSFLKSMPLDDPAVLATVSGYLLQENLGIDCMLHRYFMGGVKPKDRPDYNRETFEWNPYSPDSLATALERRTRWIGQGDVMRIGAQAIPPRDTMSLLEQMALVNSMARYIFNSSMSGSHGTTNGTSVIRWHDFLRQNVAMARRFVTVPALRQRLERIAEYMSEERPDVGNSGIMLWF